MNPYAAPVPPPPQQQFPGSSTGPVPWTSTGAIGRAWEAYKPYAVIVSLAIFVTFVLGQIPGAITQVAVSTGAVAAKSSAFQMLNLVTTIAGWLIGAFFQGGVVTMTLKVARGQDPQFGDIFAGSRVFLSMAVLNFLSTLAIGIGLLLLIIPGIIISLGLMMAPYFVVDQGLGPIEAMSASWNASKGQKGELFVLALLSGLIVLLGVCALGVGVFVALPVIQIAATVAYLHMTGRVPPAAAPPAYG